MSITLNSKKDFLKVLPETFSWTYQHVYVPSIHTTHVHLTASYLRQQPYTQKFYYVNNKERNHCLSSTDPFHFCFQGFIALNGFEPMKLDSLKKDGQPIVWTIEFVDKFMLVSYYKMAPGKSSGFSKNPLWNVFSICWWLWISGSLWIFHWDVY